MPMAPGIELLSRQPVQSPEGPPLLFVHGAYSGAWCWDEHLLPWFAARGYAAHALSLPGHGGSTGRERLDQLALADYVAAVREVVDTLPQAPILVGHSMGGMVVQKYLEQNTAPGAVLLSAVPPHGLAPSAVGLFMGRPQLLMTLNRIMQGAAPDPEHVRAALFHQPIDAATLARFIARSQPESLRALWDMTWFDLPRRLDHIRLTPLLVLGTEHDTLIPPAEVRATARAYATTAHILPGLGHAAMLEAGWRKLAARIDDWLQTPLPSALHHTA